jgi:hypothetical protein
LVAFDGPLDESVPPLVERFDGKTVKLAATFLIPVGSAPKIVGRLQLNGGELETALPAEIPFEPLSSQNSPALFQGTFSLPPESLAKPVDLALEISLQPKDGPRVFICRVQLRLFPADYFKRDIVAFFSDARDGTPSPWRVAVFGEADGLRQLLDRWKVPYQDLHGDVPAAIAAGTIAIGISAKAPDPLVIPRLDSGAGPASLLWFRPDLQKPPGVYQKAGPAGLFSAVNLVPPADWGTRPFFQRLLLEHLEQTFQLKPSHEN